MAKKVRRDISNEMEVPEGIQVTIEDHVITMKKDDKEIKRNINPEISVVQEDNKIIVSAKKARRNEKRKYGTITGHIKNMITGLTEGFEYELEICNVHFPMTVEFDKGKNEVIIKNLLGEKSPRTINVSDQAEIEIKAPKITVKSYNREIAGQTAADLEKLSRVRNRDRNKFQDGIFITKKPAMDFLQ